jgi:competence protein ComEC
MGELLARNRQLTIILVITVCLLTSLTLAALRWSLRIAIIPLAAFWMAIGCWCARIQPLPPTQQALATYADGLSRQLRGHVTRVREFPPPSNNPDEDKEYGWWPEKEANQESAVKGALLVDIKVDSIEELTPDVSRMIPITGGVRINVIADKPPSTINLANPATRAVTIPGLKCGDILEAPMRIKVAERYRDTGAWQYADYLLAQGIGAHANIRASKIALVDAPGTNNRAAQFQCNIFAAQSWASGRVLGYVRSKANRELPKLFHLSSDDAGMLNAMLFGDRVGLIKAQRVGFERTGSFHLFVVSGMHVGLLAALTFWLTRRLKLRESLSALITILLTFGYTLLTGFGAPSQRALFMTTIFLLANLLSRDRNVLNALGAAALGVLVWSPSALFESSFQMTFLAIIAIAGIASPMAERSFLPYAGASAQLKDKWLDSKLPPRVAQFRVMLRLWSETLAGLLGGWARSVPSLLARCCFWGIDLALIGAIAEMVMVLPMAFYFHRATMFAIPTNMLSVPLVALLAPSAIITFCASLVSPWIAVVPGVATALLLHGITGVINRVSAVHAADLRVPAPASWVAVVAVGGWCLCCWAVRRSGRWARVAVGVLPLIAAMVLWPQRAILSPGMMEVTALDVGQGDSIFVAGPDGATMLVDAGGPIGVAGAAQATSQFDVGEEVVSPYLWSRRLRRLDVLVLSHAHSDHMGGMPAVMRNFMPRELWVSVDPDSASYRALLAEARDLGVQVRHLHAGDQLAWGGTQVTVLAPEAGYSNTHAPGNNDSLVMRLQYGRSSVLLEGDAEAPSEGQMLAHGRVSAVTLLKVGHHGSRTSTTEAFLEAAAPKDSVVSVGKGNPFGHPRSEVVERIAEARSKLYRTDEFGLTTFLLGSDGGIQQIVGASDQ